MISQKSVRSVYCCQSDRRIYVIFLVRILKKSADFRIIYQKALYLQAKIILGIICDS